MSSNFFTPTIFRVYGIFVLLFAICSGGFYLANQEFMLEKGRDISSMLFGFYIGTPVSLGLFYKRKWAAIILSAISLYLCVGMLFDFFSVATLFWSPILVLPAFATYYCWKDLAWKGKFLA